MAINSYAGLQTAILKWLGRPGDTLISADVPDLIRLFEAEADGDDRVSTRWSEAFADLHIPDGSYTVDLPADFQSLRSIRMSSADPTYNIRYLTPDQLNTACGKYFTIEGTVIRFPAPAGANDIVTIGYMQGLRPLSDTVQTNWLLGNYPNAYLFGSLVEAEAFTGNDERASLWLQRREAAFDKIKKADTAARWSGGGLQMRPDWLLPQSTQARTGSGNYVSLTITLTPSATQTLITNVAILPSSYVHLSPETQSAAQAAVMGMWIVPGNGSAMVNHVSYDATNQTFSVIIR